MVTTRVVLLLLFVAVAASDPIKINGWYTCSARTFATPAPAKAASTVDLPPFETTAFSSSEANVWRALIRPLDATPVQALAAQAASTAPVECAEFTLPLCHFGVCSVNGSIPVFVKRMRATKRLASTKALWFLQGGPGQAHHGMTKTPAVESLMSMVYNLLDGTADMYTMDHRGTGRSHRLSCTASQIETSGSPTNGQVTSAVLSTCIQDINVQIGGTDGMLYPRTHSPHGSSSNGTPIVLDN
uniref:Secreted protein n=1 Tax=Achlya hypogyna TaxID=1202772 RepID=A0A0A7CN96_ACHHY|nr:secreted protein [Achlya hypogyna]